MKTGSKLGRMKTLTYVAEASVSRHDDLSAPHAGSRGEGSSRANEGEEGKDEAGHGV